LHFYDTVLGDTKPTVLTVAKVVLRRPLESLMWVWQISWWNRL